MATTTVAIGKLVVASRWGKPIPEGWALDDRGRPTTDPVVALRHRLLSPLGGSRELGGHKGYGLGVMVDILSGVLNGAVYGNLFERSDMKERKVHNAGHCLAAVDPRFFRPIDEFKRDMDDMIEALRSSPRAEGQERIYVAGEPELEGAETRHVVETRHCDHGDRGPRDRPAAPRGFGEDPGVAAPRGGPEDVGLIREPADPGDDAEQVKPHGDERHYWTGGREPG